MACLDLLIINANRFSGGLAGEGCGCAVVLGLFRPSSWSNGLRLYEIPGVRQSDIL